jgi:hypothetical protein
MAFALVVLFASGGVTSLHAQPTVRIVQECRSGSWTLQPMFSFGGEPQIGLSFPQESLQQRPGGGVVFFNAGQLHFYDRAGRLEATVGRQGQGPGEFQGAQALRFRGSGDLEVYDSRNMQKTVIGPGPEFAEKQVSRLLTPVAMSNTLFLPDDRILTNGDFAAPPHAGRPVHLLAPDGTILRSFGKTPPERRADVAFPLSRAIAWASGSTEAIWSAHFRQYRIEQWDLNGRLRRAVERQVPWFLPWDMDAPVTPRTPFPPHIRAVAEHAAGQLLVLLSVPPREWSHGLTARGDSWEITRVDRVVATRLEVLDHERGCVQATLDLVGYPLRLLENGVVAVYHENDATGVPEVRLFRLIGPGE